MKKITIFIYLLTISMVFASCKKEEKVLETNSRGVPMAIAEIVMGETYSVDTLYHSETATVVSISNPQFTQNIIYCGEEILANSPTLSIDTITESIYQISDVMRSARVNFANSQSVERFKHEFPQYPEFSVVVVGDTTDTGQKATFAYAVSVPSDNMKNSGKIKAWIENCLNDTMPINQSVRQFGLDMEKMFFEQFGKKESEFPYTNSRSLLVYEMTQTYVTYYDYFWGFLGGAHGMYCERFVSYSLAEGCPVTYESTFKPDCEDDIRELIYEGLAADEDFMSDHKITSLSQARSYVQHYLNGDPLPLPDPGLLQNGIAFCYQPYEIGPYADGAFQIVIPYSKISKYLKATTK